MGKRGKKAKGKSKKGASKKKSAKKKPAKKEQAPKRAARKKAAPKAEPEVEEEPVVEVPKGKQWISPVCFDARSFSQIFRQALDEAEFTYTRTQSDKLYHQTLVLFPLPKSAYVFRFQIRHPIKIFVDFYDTKPSHAGIIPYMEIHGLTQKKTTILKELLDGVIEKLPRPPWQFTITQRLQHGLMIPEWGKAKKAWRSLGFQL
jgi:hypothetical protein